MRNAGGYGQLFGAPVGSLLRLSGQKTQEIKCEAVEIDTFTCKHNGEVVHVFPGQRPEDIGGMCYQCWQLICPACVKDGRCTPFEKRLEQQERRAETLRSYDMS